MKPILDHPPRTAMEVFKILPEGTLAEVIDNQIYMAASPFYKHQKLVKALSRKLSEVVEDSGMGEICLSPFDVFLDEENNAVQPDIIIVMKPNSKIIDTDGHIHGVPDILVEVISAGNEDHDKVRKKDLYEKFGVKEYWILDPVSKLAIVYELRDKTYQLISEKKGEIKSPLLNVDVEF